METRTLKVQPISDAAMEGYGRWIRTGQQDPAATTDTFSFWNKLSILNHRATSVGLVEPQAQPEMVSTIFEQHVNTTETLIPTTGDVILVLAKPQAGATTEIDLDTVVALRLPAGDAVVLDKATWHFAPHVESGSVKVWVIFEEDTPDKDLFMRHLDEEQGIRFLVQA